MVLGKQESAVKKFITSKEKVDKATILNKPIPVDDIIIGISKEKNEKYCYMSYGDKYFSVPQASMDMIEELSDTDFEEIRKGMYDVIIEEEVSRNDRTYRILYFVEHDSNMWRN